MINHNNHPMELAAAGHTVGKGNKLVEVHCFLGNSAIIQPGSFSTQGNDNTERPGINLY